MRVVAFCITIDEQLSINRGCYFPHAGHTSSGLPFFSYYLLIIIILLILVLTALGGVV